MPAPKSHSFDALLVQEHKEPGLRVHVGFAFKLVQNLQANHLADDIAKTQLMYDSLSALEQKSCPVRVLVAIAPLLGAWSSAAGKVLQPGCHRVHAGQAYEFAPGSSKSGAAGWVVVPKGLQVVVPDAAQLRAFFGDALLVRLQALPKQLNAPGAEDLLAL